jgi:glycosyltransferase involved in cell wall biosynthesis
MDLSRVALVHDWLTIPGGAELVLEEIYRLYPATIVAAQYNAKRFPAFANAKVVTSGISELPLSKTKHYVYAPILADVYARFDMSAYDLILTDSHSFAHGVRKRTDALHICYYHTPARSLWYPEIDNRAGADPLRRMIAKRLRRLDLEASKGPDLLLANSLTTARRIEETYGRKVDEVIYPPVRTQTWSEVERSSDDEGFLAYGRLVTHKRFDLAIEAAKLTGDKLNIVGAGPLDAKLKELASGAKNIFFHGRLADADLKVLMSRSRALLFPGYEDFGIIPVEALAAGLPVIAYGEGGAVETVGREFGVLFKTQSPDCLAEAMLSIRNLGFDSGVLKSQAAKFDEEVFRTKYRDFVETAWQKWTSD